MTTGRNHDKLILLGLIPITALSTLLLPLPQAAFSVALYLFSGFLFGPDLDTHSLPYRRWGPLRFIWLPYRKLVGHHRSPLSHGPLIGTLIRVVYLGVCLAAVGVGAAYLARNFAPLVVTTWLEQILRLAAALFQKYPNTLKTALIGFLALELGAFNHYAADAVDSWLKAVQKKIVGRPN